MALSPYIQALTAPAGTANPGTTQGWLNLFAQYLQVAGLSGWTGIATGVSTPDSGDRDKPWFRTDSEGNLLGWYGWDGDSWELIPPVVGAGNTAGRPVNPEVGYQYFDTDCNTLLVYTASGWTTASGSSGDIKYVKAVDLDTALAMNPGWSECEEVRGRFLIGAGTGQGLTERGYGTTGGGETHLLTEEELPNITETITLGVGNADGNDNLDGSGGVLFRTVGTGGSHTASVTFGGDIPHNNMPPYKAFWCLIKD